MRMALALKRTIEASVVLAHPEWMENGFAGEEVQAFSDFLVYALYPGEEKEGGDYGIGNNWWREQRQQHGHIESLVGGGV